MSAFAALLAAAAMAPPPKPKVSDADAEATMRQFGTCVARGNRVRARELLDREPGSQGERTVTTKIASDQKDCLKMSGKMTFRPMALRGAIAEALYRVDFGKEAPAAAKQGDFVIQRFAVEDPALDPAARKRSQLFYAFAGCVASADPGAARAFVLSESDGDNEQKALTSLSNVLGPCLPEGNKLVVNKASLRALLAESLYRQASSAQPESVKEN